MSHYITTATSDDIEKYYNSSPKKILMTIKSKANDYVLDFEAMTQTNQQTYVQRRIRRIPEISPNLTPLNSAFGNPNSVQSYAALSRGINLEIAAILYEWQFQDEHGSWIKYGRPNSEGNVSHITTTCSGDIEKHYASNPSNPTQLIINSKNNARYVLDFRNMTQTNQQTSVRRIIRRVPKASPSNATAPKGSPFVWSFKDEHGNWIKYGETSSSNKATSATTATSDDIDPIYVQNPTASLEIAYSANYADSGSTKLMFIVKVLVGHYTVGNTSLRRPPKDASGVFYDATVDNQANPTIYVKYDNTEYYPEYYVEFT